MPERRAWLHVCVRDEIMSLAVTEGMCSDYPSHNVYSREHTVTELNPTPIHKDV
jgi:hypothetical protein